MKVHLRLIHQYDWRFQFPETNFMLIILKHSYLLTLFTTLGWTGGASLYWNVNLVILPSLSLRARFLLDVNLVLHQQGVRFLLINGQMSDQYLEMVFNIIFG